MSKYQHKVAASSSRAPHCVAGSSRVVQFLPALIVWPSYLYIMFSLDGSSCRRSKHG